MKLETKIEQLEAKHRDEVSSMQVRLTNKEAEMQKMEALLLELHRSVDQVRGEKEACRVDHDMAVIAKVQAEEALKYARAQYDELKQRSLEAEDQLQRQIKDHRMELWKTEATERSMVDRMTAMGDELERLRKVKDLAGSIGRLPSECLNDLKTEKELREAKHLAVKQAVKDIPNRTD